MPAVTCLGSSGGLSASLSSVSMEWDVDVAEHDAAAAGNRTELLCERGIDRAVDLACLEAGVRIAEGYGRGHDGN